MDNVVEVSTGRFNTIAKMSDGSIWAWGRNDFGQVGSGRTSWAENHTRIIPASLNNTQIIYILIVVAVIIYVIYRKREVIFKKYKIIERVD